MYKELLKRICIFEKIIQEKENRQTQKKKFYKTSPKYFFFKLFF
jgi:hypothetical protein